MSRNVFTIFSEKARTHQVYWVDYSGNPLTKDELQHVEARIIDSVDQKLLLGLESSFFKTEMELVHFKAGVTDNPAKSFSELLLNEPCFQNREIQVHSGVLSHQSLPANPFVEEKLVLKLENDYRMANELSFDLKVGKEVWAETYDVLGSSDVYLEELSKKNCWALSLDEMKVIQRHFQTVGRNPTDVEMEMLAQTWSEHCKHKIFNARIDYQDQDGKVQIESLFKDYIKKPTFSLNKPWAISLFDDNAGVVRFREGMDLCIKVETHNSPSALDPYGGALTGILGVNRDIMGTGLGAKPVANTNVFCVGMPGEKDLPSALIPPEKILEGVHHGVQDGGNKSGIPTVNGAIYFDESYSGKPLVYCGTVGIIPPTINGEKATQKGQRPGDLVVMVGGAVGIDGIHGATASSLVMDKTTTLGMVQIGDPFSQKRMMDFILAARDQLLFSSITDNGAGGLSSSVGEMSAATNGATLNLEKVPLKYAGLAPWQILVSESQERMTLSVPKGNWEKLQKLAETYQVPVTAVGTFTNDGYFVCRYQEKEVCRLSLTFLHDGLPKMELKANFEGKYTSWKGERKTLGVSSHDHKEIMGKLLRDPVIASKEKWIRQYDHEVQGGTAVKPMEGLKSSAPNDAGVLWYGAYHLEGKEGFAVASGLCPHFSADDTKLMTKLAVDEAVRNLLCHGADPEKIALVDNFCWPDPTPGPRNPDAEFKLAQLVRSCMGLKEMIETYRMPLVSGKDSMKNDYVGDGLKISVLPTLLVTGLGHVPDVTKSLKSQARKGDLLYRLGLKNYQEYFGHFLPRVTDIPKNNCQDFDWKKIRDLYQTIFEATQKDLLSSVHDVSEGGLMVTLFETLLMDNLGCSLNVHQNPLPFLYSELPGHFVVSVAKEKQSLFETHFSDDVREFLGEANGSGVINVQNHSLSVADLAAAWRSL